MKSQLRRSTDGTPGLGIPGKTSGKREILENYFGLVRFVTLRFGLNRAVSEQVLEERDLIQFGMLGLLDAIERFDPSREVKFETYAITRIRGAILDELRKLDWVPRSVRKKSREADRLLQQVESRTNRMLTAQEVAAKLSLTLEEYHGLLQEATGTVAESRDSEGGDPVDLLTADSSTDPYEVLTIEETRQNLIQAIESLPDRERLVITLYYYEGLTFRQIGEILKISESRVFQIHGSVLKQLRSVLVHLV